MRRTKQLTTFEALRRRYQGETLELVEHEHGWHFDTFNNGYWNWYRYSFATKELALWVAKQLHITVI